MRHRPFPTLAIAMTLCLVPAGPVLRGDVALLQRDDAFVTHDRGVWTIGNPLVRYSLGREGNTVTVRAIADPLSDRDWHRSRGPDNFVTVNGQRVDIGSSLTQFVDAAVSAHRGGVRLDLKYRVPSAALHVTRSYAVYPGSPVVETWTSYTAAGTQSVTLSDLTSYSFGIERGRLQLLTGVNAPDDKGGPFTLHEDEVPEGQPVEVGSARRTSDDHVPWFSVRVGQAQFFGAILWSGSWRLQVTRQGEDLSLQLGLPSFSTAVVPGGTLETPHAIFGLTNAFMPDTAIALKSFIERSLRRGRPYGSYVTYNTWHSHGTEIDEASLRAEIEAAAAMGIEQFVVDAGWWVGGWGTWQVDRERFPHGLAALSDRAHALGLRFGIWVEPEKVALGTVGREGLARERFLATEKGRYDAATTTAGSTSAQVCLADGEARDWVLSKVASLVDEARPDYLKWDNSFWINCTRLNHGHGAEDGNFRHVGGLQAVLDRIRAQHPHLEIENAAGGGHRLSLDMLAVSDAAWLGDRDSPAARVRHVTQALLGIFPSPYLLSPLGVGHGPGGTATAVAGGVGGLRPDDLPYAMRSRMSGAMGLSLAVAELNEGTRADVARQVALYKQIRPILLDSAAIVLVRQPTVQSGQPWLGWDAVEHVSRSTGDAVILAFDSGDGPASAVVYPQALRRDAVYDVESADYGMLGSATGAQLMAQGIEVVASRMSRGHVLILRVRASQ